MWKQGSDNRLKQLIKMERLLSSVKSTKIVSLREVCLALLFWLNVQRSVSHKPKKTLLGPALVHG